MKNLIFTALFLGSFAGVFAQIPSYVPSNGLVGWWPFTGNANDLSVNGNNGTVNGATLTTDRFGNANQAYGFDGVNDYISLNSANLPYANSDRTISIWFLKQNNNSIWSHTALSYGSASQSNALMISVGNNNLFTVQGWANDIATNQPSSNSWENLVFTLSSGLGTIYYNGNLIATQNVANWNTIQSVFYIGTRCDLNNSFFFGNIDDIGIWNRALTQQEITNLYNANNGPQATISTANNS
ncbi:MAG: LamG domain-containing protein, partial [Bacteroidetes bacterium]|nr:LamG domain-containing protein [Bacteroidota bacterium]